MRCRTNRDGREELLSRVRSIAKNSQHPITKVASRWRTPRPVMHPCVAFTGNSCRWRPAIRRILPLDLRRPRCSARSSDHIPFRLMELSRFSTCETKLTA